MSTYWNLTLNKAFCLALGLCLCLSLTAQAQTTPTPGASCQGGWQFPIRPGQVNLLAGTMGELRGGHFHGGIDIKTEGRRGLPVYATCGGYVSRIKISGGGYGHALYLTHADGSMSVYAHLDRFAEPVASYVRKAQYKQESFTVELFPEKGQFSFAQGQVVGISGNTGGSTGPHLHFEIRDAQQRPLNPLEYNFKEITDNIPPFVVRLGIAPLSHNSRVQHQFGTAEFKLRQEGSSYYLDKPVPVHGTVGLEVQAFDKLNGAPNWNGFPCIQVEMDGQQVFSQDLDRFSFNKTRHILVHTNYRHWTEKGRKYQKLYVDDGNQLGFYGAEPEQGRLHIKDTLPHKVRIELTDSYGNTTQVYLTLQGAKPQTLLPKDFAHGRLNGPHGWFIQDNTLVQYIKAEAQAYRAIEVYANRMTYVVEPAYVVNQKQVYLWDLRQGLPDSADLCGQVNRYDFKAMVPAGTAFKWFGKHLDAYFDAADLFDTLYLSTRYQYQKEQAVELFTISGGAGEGAAGHGLPALRPYEVLLKPKQDYPREQTHVYSVNEFGNYGFTGGKWLSDGVKFRTRNQGTYTLLTDTIAPTIEKLKVSPDFISLRLDDDLSGVAEYRATLNGKYVLFHHDPKTRRIYTDPFDTVFPLKGLLQVTVTDAASNEGIFSVTL